MKKIKVLLLICVLVLSSCGKDKQEDKNSANLEGVKTWTLTLQEKTESRSLIENKEEKINKIDIVEDSNKRDLWNNYYVKNEGEVYYNWKRIKDADFESFEILEPIKLETLYVSDGSSFAPYTKDKNNVYFSWKKIEWADPNTFEVLWWFYAKDKNNVYTEKIKIKNADSDTFKVLWWFYSRDKDGVYFSWKNIDWATPDTFEVLSRGYWKDWNKVYFLDDIIKYELDLNTIYFFKDSIFIKDKNGIYCGRKKLNNADIDTFEILEFWYAKDKNNIYRDAFLCSISKVNWANPESFNVITQSFSKDENNIYYLDNKIEGADLETFEVLKKSYGKDKSNVYFRWKPIKWGELETLRYWI